MTGKKLYFIPLLFLVMLCSAEYSSVASAQNVRDSAEDMPRERTRQQRAKPARKPAVRPARKRTRRRTSSPKLGSFDGTYDISAVRTAVRNSFTCLTTYSMRLRVTKGRAGHQVPFSHYVSGSVRGSKLYMSSRPESDGGHWVGVFNLDRRRGKRTSGYFKWTGNNTICAFQAVIVRE